MNSRFWIPLFAILLAILACGGEEGQDPTPFPEIDFQEAPVVKVVDGDTIDVLIDGVEYRVRYILVDTPETKHPTKGVEPFGPEAFEANRELVENKVIRLEKDVSDNDRYGRLLRYVYVGDLMVNEELIRRGLARVATFPPDVKYVDRFLAVQREAQAAGVGIWGDEPVVRDSIIITAVNVRDEYVDIQNTGREPVDLAGWSLVSENGSQACDLGRTIQSGETLRIWALAKDADQGGYNCGFSRNIWSNSEPDPAVLYDPKGVEVSRKD